jgi:hypothetical protein
MLSGIKGLVSGLFTGESGSSSESGQSTSGVSHQLSALLPYIQRMIASRNRALPARKSLREELEEEE